MSSALAEYGWQGRDDIDTWLFLGCIPHVFQRRGHIRWQALPDGRRHAVLFLPCKSVLFGAEEGVHLQGRAGQSLRFTLTTDKAL